MRKSLIAMDTNLLILLSLLLLFPILLLLLLILILLMLLLLLRILFRLGLRDFLNTLAASMALECLRVRHTYSALCYLVWSQLRFVLVMDPVRSYHSITAWDF